MKKVLIANLKGGEILAQEIWNDKGGQLLAKGTTYKNSYFHKLSNLGKMYIYIQDDTPIEMPELRKEFNPRTLQENNKRLVTKQLKRFNDNGSISVYKFEKLVYDIIGEVTNSKNVLENMYRIKDYNHYTYEHSLNVSVIAIMIAKQMRLDRYDIYEIAMGCILHDLGKIQITQAILNKPTTLEKEERQAIREHPISGYNIIKTNNHITENIKEIILNHHEKLDGSGYPFGIGKEQISMSTRICSVADVFDAMCSERPYKAAAPFAESMRNMKTNMCKKLDMDVCTILEGILQ